MTAPRLSFVIPAHNAQAYLAEAIASCLRQTVKAIEVVVVDDGSTDMTRSIADYFADSDKRVRAISLSPGKGRGTARNVGNSDARAPIIAVLDADDLSDPRRVDRTLKALRPGHAVYGRASIVNAFSQHDGEIGIIPFDHTEAIDKGLNGIVHSTMAYWKKDAMRIRYDEGEYAEAGLDDWLFQLSLAVKGGIGFVPIDHILSAYRVHAAGVSATRKQELVKSLKDKALEGFRVEQAA